MRTVLVGWCLLAGLIASRGVAAQTEDKALAAEVAAMNRTLEKLVSLLEEVRDHQKVDLVLKRIELRERRIAPLEAKLRSTESAIEDVESHLRQMQLMMEEAEGVRSEGIRDNNEPAVTGAETEISELERVIKLETSRLEDLRQAVIVVENDLVSSRKEIEILDDLLRELIE